MSERIIGQVEAGTQDASVWLTRFNAAYARKLGAPVFPGSLNLRLPHVFDWMNPRYEPALIRFDRSEYGGERDILFLPCRLDSLNRHPAHLWTTTTRRQGADLYLLEIVADISLRDTFGLKDGDVIAVDLGLDGKAGGAA
jgi:CTP-dependent riboflavin kinase